MVAYFMIFFISFSLTIDLMKRKPTVRLNTFLTFKSIFPYGCVLGYLSFCFIGCTAIRDCNISKLHSLVFLIQYSLTLFFVIVGIYKSLSNFNCLWGFCVWSLHCYALLFVSFLVFSSLVQSLLPKDNFLRTYLTSLQLVNVSLPFTIV